MVSIDNMKLEHGTHNIMLDDVSPAGLAYLLQYGFAKSLQDAVSGWKGTLEDGLAGKLDLEDAKGKMFVRLTKDYDRDDYGSDAEMIETILNDAQQERVNNIIDGEVSVGARGPRLLGLDRIMQDVALENLKGIAKKNKVSLPTKAADLKIMIGNYIEKYGDKVRPEAERRFALQEAEGESIDLSDLLK